MLKFLRGKVSVSLAIAAAVLVIGIQESKADDTIMVSCSLDNSIDDMLVAGLKYSTFQLAKIKAKYDKSSDRYLISPLESQRLIALCIQRYTEANSQVKHPEFHKLFEPRFTLVAQKQNFFGSLAKDLRYIGRSEECISQLPLPFDVARNEARTQALQIDKLSKSNNPKARAFSQKIKKALNLPEVGFDPAHPENYVHLGRHVILNQISMYKAYQQRSQRMRDRLSHSLPRYQNELNSLSSQIADIKQTLSEKGLDKKSEANKVNKLKLSNGKVLFERTSGKYALTSKELVSLAKEKHEVEQRIKDLEEEGLGRWEDKEVRTPTSSLFSSIKSWLKARYGKSKS